MSPFGASLSRALATLCAIVALVAGIGVSAIAAADPATASTGLCLPDAPRPGGPLDYRWTGGTAHPSWISAPVVKKTAVATTVKWTAQKGIAFAGATGAAYTPKMDCAALPVKASTSPKTGATTIVVTIKAGFKMPTVWFQAASLNFTPEVKVSATGMVSVRIRNRGSVPLSFTTLASGLGQRYSASPVAAGRTSAWVTLPKAMPSGASRTVTVSVRWYGREDLASGYNTKYVSVRRP